MPDVRQLLLLTPDRTHFRTSSRVRDLVVHAAVAVALASLMACGPGFFAREAQDPQDVAAAELDDSGPDPELLPKGPAGLGCSPKGCLDDAPMAAAAPEPA